MRICSKCLLPETKPDLSFDGEGVCSACRNYERRAQVKWRRQAELFQEQVKAFRGSGPYDCIIPVSGGKDSHFQAITCRHYGLRPLLVTATTCHLTPLGRKNLDNLHSLGFDFMEVGPSPTLRAKLNRVGLEQVGDISWPEHATIFSIPVRIAMALGVRLIIWGENPQNEYGDPGDGSAMTNMLTPAWVTRFGGLLGLTPEQLKAYAIEEDELLLYTYPKADPNKPAPIGLFLGYYFPWDGGANAMMAKEYGFEFYRKDVEGSIVPYENLDNAQTGIHDYFKYLKYGFGRATDIASSLIRRKAISREEAAHMVLHRDGAFPSVYVDTSLEDVLARIGMSHSKFLAVAESYKNTHIFTEAPVHELERREPALNLERNVWEVGHV